MLPFYWLWRLVWILGTIFQPLSPIIIEPFADTSYTNNQILVYIHNSHRYWATVPQRQTAFSGWPMQSTGNTTLSILELTDIRAMRKWDTGQQSLTPSSDRKNAYKNLSKFTTKNADYKSKLLWLNRIYYNDTCILQLFYMKYNYICLFKTASDNNLRLYNEPIYC